MDINKKLAAEFSLRDTQIEKTVALIDEGNTIPFIARYRKEATGGLSDVTLRELDERLAYLRSLEERKQEVIRLIDEQGKLTDDLKQEIEKAEVLQRVEDLYKPYKKKKADNLNLQDFSHSHEAEEICNQPSRAGPRGYFHT